MVMAGTSIEDSVKAKSLSSDWLKYTVGIHPCHSNTFNEDSIEEMESLID